MYPEFIAIYVGIIVLIVLAVLILLKLKKLSDQLDNDVTYTAQGGYDMSNAYNAQNQYQNQYQTNANMQGQVVYCRNCATQYDASSPYCPACGTPR